MARSYWYLIHFGFLVMTAEIETLRRKELLAGMESWDMSFWLNCSLIFYSTSVCSRNSSSPAPVGSPALASGDGWRGPAGECLKGISALWPLGELSGVSSEVPWSATSSRSSISSTTSSIMRFPIELNLLSRSPKDRLTVDLAGPKRFPRLDFEFYLACSLSMFVLSNTMMRRLATSILWRVSIRRSFLTLDCLLRILANYTNVPLYRAFLQL